MRVAAAQRVAAPAPAANEEKRRWCRQRFIDFLDGKRPGGAKTLEQKLSDDHLCERLR